MSIKWSFVASFLLLASSVGAQSISNAPQPDAAAVASLDAHRTAFFAVEEAALEAGLSLDLDRREAVYSADLIARTFMGWPVTFEDRKLFRHLGPLIAAARAAANNYPAVFSAARLRQISNLIDPYNQDPPPNPGDSGIHCGAITAIQVPQHCGGNFTLPCTVPEDCFRMPMNSSCPGCWTCPSQTGRRWAQLAWDQNMEACRVVCDECLPGWQWLGIPGGVSGLCLNDRVDATDLYWDEPRSRN